MSEIVERGIDSLHAYVPPHLAVKSSHPRLSLAALRVTSPSLWVISKAQPTEMSIEPLSRSLEVRTRFERVYTVLQTVD